MKQLIQSLALITLFGSLSQLSLSQEVKQVQRAEKNYVDSKKVESKEPQTTRAIVTKKDQYSIVNPSLNQQSNNKNEVQKLSVGTKRPLITASDRIKEIEAHLEAIERKEAFIKEDPKEIKIAEEENWFEKMETLKKELRAEKAALEKNILNEK